MKQPVILVLNYKKTNSFALNTIAGAVETGCPDVEILFATGAERVCEAIARAHERKHTVVVGWSFHSPQFEKIPGELNWIRHRSPPAIHLAGGVHATAEPEQTLRAGFDYAAIGEGERTIVEFLARLQRRELPPHPAFAALTSALSREGRGNPAGMRGIACLKDGALVSGGAGERIELDDFPPFAPAHFKVNPIQITRGCIYACSYCQTSFMFGGEFRHRSVENVCENVRIMKRHRATDIRFITPTALSYGSPDENVKLDKVEELLAGVRSVLGKDGRVFFGTFPSELRPEHVTPEALRMIKRYVDNDNVVIGGQSGSQDVLESIGRSHSVEAIETAVRIIKEEGFLANVDFIFGLPGETPADTDATLKLAQRLGEMGARVHAHTFIPLPGTPLRSAPAGQLDAKTIARLERMASHGKLYGQWKQQHRGVTKDQ
ncbi:MAG TPA: TIGR04013 family B12-binding domain/radical SAM domain-containing protein [Planctomycetota bacterium]